MYDIEKEVVSMSRKQIIPMDEVVKEFECKLPFTR